MANRKLGRTSSHRGAMFRNQLASLIEHERIVTTLPKAKELRPLIEKLVTLAKIDNVHNRRNAARSIDEAQVAKLFATIGPRFTERPGGYTRIIKIGPRRGDAAEMAILEFVGYELKGGDSEMAAAPAATASKGGSKKAAPKAEAAEAGDEKPKKAKKAAAPKADDAGDEKPKKAPRKKKEE